MSSFLATDNKPGWRRVKVWVGQTMECIILLPVLRQLVAQRLARR